MRDDRASSSTSLISEPVRGYDGGGEEVEEVGKGRSVMMMMMMRRRRFMRR